MLRDARGRAPHTHESPNARAAPLPWPPQETPRTTTKPADRTLRTGVRGRLRRRVAGLAVVGVDVVAEVQPVVDLDRLGDLGAQAAVAGGVDRRRVVAVDGVAAREEARVVHAV